MLTLIQEAGFPIWFVLAFGALTLLTCARYAANPRLEKLPLAGALGLATLFSTFTAICADLATVGHQGRPSWRSTQALRYTRFYFKAGAESLSPAIIGCSVLTLAALLVALGCHRAQEVL